MGKLLKKLKDYADSDYLSMHMPGHKRCMGEIGNPYFIDITEIDGFDNLHQAEGILLEAQERAASLYGSEETHYLVNGSTAGILSAISGCTSFGGNILLARNSHKSAYHAACLRGLHVRYIYPQSDEMMGINGVILPSDVEKSLRDHPELQAVMITSPTYDGVVSDVKAIAGIVHRYGISLIVDEAHGAHFPFSGHFPEDSISCGADVVIHSLHKTLPSLTQTALIHLNGNLADRKKIRNFLSVYQSSSPSYVLMASLDNCVEWVSSHPYVFESFCKELQRVRKELRLLRSLKLLEIPGMDPCKILISVRNTGINGRELQNILRREFHVELEMACDSYVCAITTVADTKESFSRLLRALQEVDNRISGKKDFFSSGSRTGSDEVLPAVSVCTMLEAEENEKESCLLEQSEGRISGGFVTLYPPGIPILAPGEKISKEILNRLLLYERDGFEVQGIENHHSVQVLRRIH